MYRNGGEGGFGGSGPGSEAMSIAWSRVQVRLRAELGEDVYSSWFRSLMLESIDTGTANFTVPTKFLRSWLEQHFADRILALLGEEALGVERVSVTVRACSRTIAIPASAAVAPRAAPAPLPVINGEPSTLIGSPLDRRLAFETFLVGRSNELAHAAALQVGRAKSRELVSFNPLYIHAAVGLGKTHILQAIAGAVEASRRRVLYLTAERFIFGFVSALKRDRRRLQGASRGIDSSSSTTCNSCRARRRSRSSATR